MHLVSFGQFGSRDGITPLMKSLYFLRLKIFQCLQFDVPVALFNDKLRYFGIIHFRFAIRNLPTRLRDHVKNFLDLGVVDPFRRLSASRR